MGCSKSSSKTEVYSKTILPQETNKTPNRQPNSTPKTTGKRKTNKQQQQQNKISSRIEIIRIRAEIIEKRHRCVEQSFVLCRRGRGWDDLGECHGNMYNIIYEMNRQSRFDA